MKKYLIYGIGIVVVIVAFVSSMKGGGGITRVGSIGDGQGYDATTTYDGHTFAINMNQTQVLKKNSQGFFGGIILTGAAAGAMRFYDATSSTDVASTSIINFPVSLSAGNYGMDVQFSRGLIVEFSSATIVPTTTILKR